MMHFPRSIGYFLIVFFNSPWAARLRNEAVIIEENFVSLNSTWIRASEHGTKIQLSEKNKTDGKNFNFSSSLDSDSDYPFFTGSCPKNNCSNYSDDNATYNRVTDRSCNCDEKCIHYRDCCVDSKYYDSEEQRKPSQYQCRTYDDNRYFVKSVCPSSWNNKKIREKCSMSEVYLNLNIKDVELGLPATSIKTNITYGNIYCAICNAENNVKLWNIEVVYNCSSDINPALCKNLNNLKIGDLQFNNRWYFMLNGTAKYCDLKPYPPHIMKIEYCWYYPIINSCPTTWVDLDIKEKCNGPYLRVTDTEHYQLYKNKYCALCNRAKENNLFCYVFDPGTRLGENEMASSFIILFDFEKSFKLCHQNQTSWTEGACLIEQNATETSTNENWFFSAYTSIAISVSLFFLVIHLTIFSYVKELHTIGGKCMASYCVALMLAYGTFLMGNVVDGTICTIVAILMYYFFLSAFTWMLVISYDIWKTFWNVTKHLQSPSKTQKTFRIYSLSCWSAPLIAVWIVVFLHCFRADSRLAPHFGENTCWFQNGYALLIFFVLPVCLIVIINFAFFFHTSIMVRSNQCQSVNRKSQVDFKLFARIALLTGITWVTGFVGGYTQEPVIWFIFILLNTAQGVFIFIAFSCKKQIICTFLKRIGVLENWQMRLQESTSKSTDNKSTTLTNISSK